MAEGIEHFDEFGERIEGMSFSADAADRVRDMAIFEGRTLEEVVGDAVLLYETHLQLTREGWTGPYYERKHEPTTFVGKILGSSAMDRILCKHRPHQAPPETT